jgi:hypothetical protein
MGLRREGPLVGMRVGVEKEGTPQPAGEGGGSSGAGQRSGAHTVQLLCWWSLQ